MCLFFRYLYLTLHILYEHEQIIEKLENMQEIKGMILIIYTIIFKTITIIKKKKAVRQMRERKLNPKEDQPILCF